MFKNVLRTAVVFSIALSASSALAKSKKSSNKKTSEEASATTESSASGKSSCLVTAQQAADAICRINECQDLEVTYQGLEGGAEKFGDKKGFMSIRAVSGNGETVCVITRVIYNPKP